MHSTQEKIRSLVIGNKRTIKSLTQNDKANCKFKNFLGLPYKTGCPATWKTWNTQEFDLPQGKPGKLREFFCLSMRIFYMVFFLNCYQVTIEKLFAKITTVYKKPQGILLKLTLENLEISGNFVLEIGWTRVS